MWKPQRNGKKGRKKGRTPQTWSHPPTHVLASKAPVRPRGPAGSPGHAPPDLVLQMQESTAPSLTPSRGHMSPRRSCLQRQLRGHPLWGRIPPGCAPHPAGHIRVTRVHLLYLLSFSCACSNRRRRALPCAGLGLREECDVLAGTAALGDGWEHRLLEATGPAGPGPGKPLPGLPTGFPGPRDRPRGPRCSPGPSPRVGWPQ